MKFVQQERKRWGVQPICRVLEIAPSSFYAATTRPASARELRDQELKPEIERVHRENYEVYGLRKLWRQLGREGYQAPTTSRSPVALTPVAIRTAIEITRPFSRTFSKVASSIR